MSVARRPIDQAHRDAVTGIHGIVVSATSSVGLGPSGLAANTGGANTAVGYKALTTNTSGIGSTAVGFEALDVNNGNYNTAVGMSSQGGCTTGIENTAIGYQSLFINSSSNYNSAFGAQSLAACTGVGNTALGRHALFGVTSTNYNTGVGLYAGRFLADGSTANQTPANCTYVGYSTKGGAAGASNETVIGNGAIGGGSNTVRLGNTAVTNWLPGVTNVCYLGNATTAFKGLYLSDGTDEYLLTVNTSGALVIAKQ